MKYGRHLGAAALAATFLIGCASGVNEKFLTGKEKESDTGLVVVTYAISGQWRNSQNADVWFRSLDGKVRGTVNNPTRSPRYLVSGQAMPESVPLGLKINPADPIGGVNVLRLAAGEYEFHFFDSSKAKPLPTALIRANFQARGDFSAKFTVKPGAITYVGRLHFSYPPERRVTFQIVDKSGEDIPAFKREYEQFKSAAVETAVPTFTY